MSNCVASSLGSASKRSPLVQQQRELALQNAQLRKEIRALHEAARLHLAHAAHGEDALLHDDPLEQLLEEEGRVRQQLQREVALQSELERESVLLGEEIAALDRQIRAERLVRGALLHVLTGGAENPASAGRKERRQRRQDDAAQRLEIARREAHAALQRHQELLLQLDSAQRRAQMKVI